MDLSETTMLILCRQSLEAMPTHHWLLDHEGLSVNVSKRLPLSANGAYIRDLIRRRYLYLSDASYLKVWPCPTLFLVVSSLDMVYWMTRCRK